MRTQTLQALKKYLHSRDMNKADLLKIWKGLFYCMWMSDKMPVQEELSTNLASLMHSCRTVSSALLFIGAFYATMIREWPLLDRLRLDK